MVSNLPKATRPGLECMSPFHPIKPLLAQELGEASVVSIEMKMQIHFIEEKGQNPKLLPIRK